jgi:IclR family acetate operon transcriptional repressor
MNAPGQSKLDAPRSHTVGVLAKAIDVLEVLAFGPPMTLREITERSHIEKAAVYRILNTFEERGLASRDSDRRYAAGARLITLASALVSGRDMVAELLPVMKDLRDEFQETVNLGVLVGDSVQYLAIVESQLSLRMTAETGSLHRARSTALGKALLAAAPTDEPGATDGTMPTGTEGDDPFVAELRRTRERGYAIDFEENERGAICVAAVISRPGQNRSYAISVSGPITRMTPETVERIGARLQTLGEH